ncbi:MAG TPA: glycosyltransferase family 2 protein, partial [bacterium]|nr:glycosyltransferase family 2 protein [bacterium]
PFLEEGYDVVIGSRNLSGSDLVVRQPFYRRVMGRVFNGLVRAVAVGGIADTQCGFKCFTRAAMSSIAPRCRIDGFSFDVEMLYLARRLGYRIREVPVKWLNAEGSTVSPVRDSLRMFRDVLRVRINAAAGRYS